MPREDPTLHEACADASPSLVSGAVVWPAIPAHHQLLPDYAPAAHNPHRLLPAPMPLYPCTINASDILTSHNRLMYLRPLVY